MNKKGAKRRKHLKQLRIMAAALQAMTLTDMIIYPEDYMQLPLLNLRKNSNNNKEINHQQMGAWLNTNN
jgi:hypothetical protein